MTSALPASQEILSGMTVLLEEAELLIRARSILAARIILGEILRLDAGNIRCLVDLSVCDAIENKHDDAKYRLERIFKLDPKVQHTAAILEAFERTSENADPRISIVIPSRNDNFGGRLIETATATLQTMSKTFDEVILVDFGSFHEPMHSIVRRTIQERKGNIRVITVPRSWVLAKLQDDNTFTDVWARNIGIRRATHDIIVSSNIDIIPGPRDCFDFSQFDENVFYSSNKYMIERSLVDKLRGDGVSWMGLQCCLFETRQQYYRQQGYDGDPWSKVSGCGDFQIGHRRIWFHDQVRGFEESLIYKDHTDTNLHKKIIENAGHDVQPALFFHVFHQSHENIRGKCLQNDLHASVHGFGRTTNPVNWGFAQENFEEYRI